MSNQISPKYQMNIIQNINDKLYELFKSYDCLLYTSDAADEL